VAYLEKFKANKQNELLLEPMDIDGRLQKTKQMLAYAESKQYLSDLVGTIGADPLYKNRA
jgi:hypothetical protein